MAGEELRLPALEMTQAPGLAVYLFAVDGKQLGRFTTVARARRGGPGAQLLGYQRPLVLRHIEEIRHYLDSPGALLPNALTVAFDGRARFEPLPVPASVSYARFGVLIVPDCSHLAEHDRPGWLVDGQQRAEAIARAARASLPVAVAAFIDADEASQREQFLRVNATKPLPRSLLYELLPHTPGPLPAALERRRLPAILSERLNYDPASPLHLMIRTVTNPDGPIQDNSILRTLGNSIGYGALAPYDARGGTGPDITGMLAVVNHFWAAVRDVFPAAWGLPPRKSRLMHGAGVLTLGFLMDAIAAAREWPPPTVDTFADGLRLIAPLCRWTGGAWEFGRSWNHIQNTSQDARLLSDYLTSRYLAARRTPAGPGLDHRWRESMTRQRPAPPGPRRSAEEERLTAENARLQDRVRLLEKRCGQLMVDGDRRERRAAELAEQCPEHGKEIQYLRHVASWYWAAMNQQESARRAIIGVIGQVLLGLRGQTAPVSAETLSGWLERVIRAQDKVLRRPAGYPVLADCLRGGGCAHGGLAGGLADEIAAALGLRPAPAGRPGNGQRGPGRSRARRRGGDLP